MTNRSQFDDSDALARLGDLCDAFLLHNRPIRRAVDDSVILDAPAAPIFVRRSRGYVPTPIALPPGCNAIPGLAVGAEMKCTIATCRNGQVVLSQHLGNLTHHQAFTAFKQAIVDQTHLFSVTAAVDSRTTCIPRISVRNLRSNLPISGEYRSSPCNIITPNAAAVLAENQTAGPALAIICDGTGYGLDGTVWVVNCSSLR